jgi:carbon-monoxide dehydrogenase medium subunit
MAAILEIEDQAVKSASITLGAVAPTIIHAEMAEEYLIGKELTDEVIEEAALLAQRSAKPIDDVRGSAAYREEITRVLVRRGLTQLKDGREGDGLPEKPVLLVSSNGEIRETYDHPLREGETPIKTTINGRQYIFDQGHGTTLLHLVRDFAGLTGSKVGCEEGECGACTVFLDGKAVMACLVPAPRAHLAEIITIEGLGDAENLHPVQQAFIEEGAVQCGYCTPGFIMSAAKLFEERTEPTEDEIKTAISGNLCRCTGYYKIIRAIEKTSQKEGA